MAINKRSFPNDYFAWYNDDNRIGIVNRITSTDDSEGFTSGEYDTYSDSTITSGLKIHYHSKYPEVDNIDNDLYLVQIVNNYPTMNSFTLEVFDVIDSYTTPELNLYWLI